MHVSAQKAIADVYETVVRYVVSTFNKRLSIFVVCVYFNIRSSSTVIFMYF